MLCIYKSSQYNSSGSSENEPHKLAYYLWHEGYFPVKLVQMNI